MNHQRTIGDDGQTIESMIALLHFGSRRLDSPLGPNNVGCLVLKWFLAGFSGKFGSFSMFSMVAFHAPCHVGCDQGDVMTEFAPATCASDRQHVATCAQPMIWL